MAKSQGALSQTIGYFHVPANLTNLATGVVVLSSPGEFFGIQINIKGSAAETLTIYDDGVAGAITAGNTIAIIDLQNGFFGGPIECNLSKGLSIKASGVTGAFDLTLMTGK